MAGTVLRSGTISTTLWHDRPADDSFVIESVQDVQEIVDLNKAEYNSVKHPSFKGDHDRMIARIPLTVYFKLMREGIITVRGDCDPIRFNRWLADPENRHFRTLSGAYW